MPNVAPMLVVPVHASLAQRHNVQAGDKPAEKRDFDKLIREQSGPIEPLKSDEGVAAAVSSSISAAALEGSNTFGSLIGGQPESVLKQVSSESGTMGGPTTETEVQPAPKMNRLSIESGGTAKPGLIAAAVGEPSSTLTKEIPCGRCGATDLRSSPHAKESQTASKKVSQTSSDKKTEIAAVPLPLVQIGLSTLPLPRVPASSFVGVAAERTGAENGSISQHWNLRNQQLSEIQGGRSQVWEAGQSPASFPILEPDGGNVSQTAPSAPEFAFDAHANGRETILNSADLSGLSKPSAQAAVPSTSRAASEKLIAKPDATVGSLGAPVPASAETPMAGTQHVGVDPSAAPGVTGSTGNTVGTGAPNLYDRIDQGNAPVVLHSAAQHVSVGVHDPDLGWVEIQAQSAAGHVDATLVASSGQTHASLAAQLPSIAQYLEQRDVRVGTLIVNHHAAGGGSSAAGGGGSGYGSTNSGAGAHHSNSGSSEGGRAAPRFSYASARRGRAGQGIGGGVQGSDDGAAIRGISYISVRV